MTANEQNEIENLSTFIYCPECGEMRVFIETGVVCPNGHGKIHPCRSPSYIDRAQRRVVFLKLPELVRIGNRKRYTIVGRGGVFKRAKGETASSVMCRYGKKRRRVIEVFETAKTPN